MASRTTENNLAKKDKRSQENVMTLPVCCDLCFSDENNEKGSTFFLFIIFVRALSENWLQSNKEKVLHRFFKLPLVMKPSEVKP